VPDARSPPDSTELSLVRQQFKTAARLTHQVDPHRLVMGHYDHEQDRCLGGDISASYSADVIAMQGRVRRPFQFQGQLLTAVSLSSLGGRLSVVAYTLVPVETYCGTSISYKEQMANADTAEAARQDPAGAYNGIRVKWRDKIYVLSGAPAVFVPREADHRDSSENKAPDGQPSTVAARPKAAGAAPQPAVPTQLNLFSARGAAQLTKS
jgi:hypothetical protein